MMLTAREMMSKTDTVVPGLTVSCLQKSSKDAGNLSKIPCPLLSGLGEPQKRLEK